MDRPLDQIARLVESGKHKEALTLLMEMEESSLAPEVAALRHLLLGDVKIALGDYEHDHVHRAIAFYKRSDRHDEYARAKFLEGWMLQNLGRMVDAQEPLIESYAAYLRTDNYNGAACSLNKHSYMKFQCGDMTSASDSLTKAIGYYEKAGNKEKARLLRVNHASIHFISGSFKTAIQIFDEVEKDIGRFTTRDKGVFYMCRAMACGLSGSLKDSDKYVKEAEKFVKGYKRDEANLLEYQGWLLYLKGEFQEARSVLLEGLIAAQAIAPQSALISQTKRLLADTNFALTDYARAKAYATEALEVAEKINERAEIAACWRVFGRLAAYDKQNHEAREWFDKAANLYSMISSRYELAVTRFFASLTGVYPPAEATAMLSMANEYFGSESVTPYIEKTAGALRDLKKTSPVKIDPPARDALPNIITQNVRMRKLLDLAENIAPSEMTVLLTGETGTGKDLMARYIHAYSGRKGDFVSVNAAAIPHEMAESELFGHTKGAFTGAASARKGLIEQAEGGTFYLNEIGDTSPAFQAKLLEVLESKTIRRLGENTEKKVGFRLIAATNHDLPKRVSEGTFRADLYHRLNQIPIHMPPLSDRLDDIPSLLIHFIGQNGTDKAVFKQKRQLDKIAKRLGEMIWPGNIRQIELAIQRWWHDSGENLKAMFNLLPEPTDLSRERLIVLLEETEWNRRETARLLNISEGTVRYRMKKLGLEDPAAVI